MDRSRFRKRVVSDLSHDLHVSVASPEEAEDGVAEFWVGDHLFGFTRLEEGEPVLRIEPRSDGGAIVVSARSLAAALAQAKLLLEPS
jgi:hypothetical protein